MIVALCLWMQVLAGPEASFWAPPRTPNVTRVRATTRPFLSVPSQGAGAINDLTIEHDRPGHLHLELALAPVAVALQSGKAGGSAYLWAGAGYATDLVAAGLSLGLHTHSFAAGGPGLALRARLGAQDGIHLAVRYAYDFFRDRQNQDWRFGFSQIAFRFEVPVARTASLAADFTWRPELWLFLGGSLRHYIQGRGSPAGWVVEVGFGLAGVVDRWSCAYEYSARCEGTAYAFGPTLVAGVERRF